jgi:hypothetical protein
MIASRAKFADTFLLISAGAAQATGERERRETLPKGQSMLNPLQSAHLSDPRPRSIKQRGPEEARRQPHQL